MNLLDFRDDADVAGVGGRAASWPPRTASSSPESELIGLAPLAAFTDVADHADAPADGAVEARLAAAAAAIRLRDFAPLMALELRLAAARDAAGGEA